MSDQKNQQDQQDHSKQIMHKVEKSAFLSIVGIIFLFSFAVILIMFLPMFIDKSWVSPSSPYQVQMYEVEDPNVYISSASPSGMGGELQQVHHLKKDFTLLAFQENEGQRFVTTSELEKYITRYSDSKLKLTSRILLLRIPQGEMKKKSEERLKGLNQEWEEKNPDWQKQDLVKTAYHILELFDPGKAEIFAYNPSHGILQNWVDNDFEIIDGEFKQPYHQDYGVVYVLNPREYLVKAIHFGDQTFVQYDPDGTPISSIDQLMKLGMGFRSRKELITLGEHIYAIEGCWYCHTDQTRTLVQDVVLNGSDSYPAPPSSPNEYIYQKITFPGTRRIGPDISRTGVKRPSRDWHKAHFWAPKTASAGSIMPSFQHFFDNDPRGTSKSIGIPNYRFEAIYQYLITKGTRITPPTQAWWTGKDPIKTIDIIEGRKGK